MQFDAARQYVSRFVSLTDEEFDFLVQKLEIREFGKKELLIGEGRSGTIPEFYHKGARAESFSIRKKEEMVTQIAVENDLISSYESFTTLPERLSTYVVETIEPTTFISISRQEYCGVAVCGQFPKMERFRGRMMVTQQFLNKEHWGIRSHAA